MAYGRDQYESIGRLPLVKFSAIADSALRYLPHAVASDRRAMCAALHQSIVATGDARRLRARSPLPPFRGYTPSAPRYGLPCVGCLKQLPKPVCQQFDGLLQGAELPNSDQRYGSVQVKRWGTQYFHGIDRLIPGNKASG